MKRLYTFMSFAAFGALGSMGFAQTISYSTDQYADTVPGCSSDFVIGLSIGSMPETAGVVMVNWGDGSTENFTYTTSAGETYAWMNPTHGYALAGDYTVTVDVYSGTAGAAVGTQQTLELTAQDAANCGYVYVYTQQTSPPIYFDNVPMDFTGADGITTTILPYQSGNYFSGYAGLNIANTPYLVSVNDTWLTTNGLSQITPDFTINSFSSGGLADAGTQNMIVSCNTAAANPDFDVQYAYSGGFVAPLQAGSVNMYICNYACSNTADAQVSLTFPAGFVPDYSLLTNAGVTGNVLTFDLLALSDCQYVHIPFSFPGTVVAGTVLDFNVTVNNTNDTDLSNNSNDFTGIVQNSYDPNNKLTDKPQNIDAGVTEKIVYVINFQNEGNFAAMDVIVQDTISASLDLSTFEVLGSKHGVATSVNPATRVVTFSFNDINLAPADTDEEDSKGYIVYSIRENAGLPVNSEIENTAYIYFDFNPAIITNTTLNVNTVLGVNELSNESIAMYPNPAAASVRFEGAAVTGVQIFDLTGKSVLANAAVVSNELSVAALSNGVYQVVITTAKGMQVQKLVIRK